jgi:hypothetical protein
MILFETVSLNMRVSNPPIRSETTRIGPRILYLRLWSSARVGLTVQDKGERFMWKGLLKEMAAAGFRLVNYPPLLPLPHILANSKSSAVGPNLRGIGAVEPHYRQALLDAFQSKDKQMTFEPEREGELRV